MIRSSMVLPSLNLTIIQISATPVGWLRNGSASRVSFDQLENLSERFYALLLVKGYRLGVCDHPPGAGDICTQQKRVDNNGELEEM